MLYASDCLNTVFTLAVCSSKNNSENGNRDVALTATTITADLERTQPTESAARLNGKNSTDRCDPSARLFPLAEVAKQIRESSPTSVGVAPEEFHGTLVFFFPHFFVPIVDQEQVEGKNNLNERGKRSVFSVMGHLKAGVTREQAIADLNSIGADLEKSYPKEDNDITFTLAPPHPNLDQGDGPSSVCPPYGDAVAGSAGRDGRDAVCDWHLWNGCVLCKQAAEGIGNSYGARLSVRKCYRRR